MGRQRGWRIKKRPRFWIGAVLLAAALLVVLYGYWMISPLNANNHHARYVRVTAGQTADGIGATLERAGIIRSALAFSLLSRMDGLSTHLTTGVYRLSPSQSLKSILEKMRSGDVVTIKVTIPEGFTVSQIVDRLVAHHIGDKKDYERLLQHPFPGMPTPGPGVRDPFEGYLFPATYSFPYETTPKAALTIMWQTFHARVIEGLYRRAHESLSLTQWVTLASIVQKEDQNGSQAPGVAAVFINRMANHMPFQSDATVRYAMGHAVVGGLTLGDLGYASPYNTYLHKGLPPGPISNPGLTMLNAALHPVHVPYLYFLSLRNGRILFATTYQQHLANIAYAQAHHGL